MVMFAMDVSEEESDLLALLRESKLKIVKSKCDLGPLTCPFRGDIAQIRGEMKKIKEGVELMKKHYEKLSEKHE